MPKPLQSVARRFGLVEPLRITEGITRRQIAVILKRAAADAERIALIHDRGLARVRLQNINRELSRLSTEMWSKVGEATQGGMYTQGNLALKQAIEIDLMAGVPQDISDSIAQAMHFEARQAVDDIISRRTNGYKLSDRIYLNGKASTKQVGAIVEKHLALQSSARDLAREVRRFYAPNVPGGASYASMRLARTEINNAHHDTTLRLAEDKPWVLGFKWNLSGSHSRPDECNEYADHGTYEPKAVPSKPHPQCLCYLTHIVEDDDVLIDKLANGKYDGYLDDRRIGVKQGRVNTSNVIDIRRNQ